MRKEIIHLYHRACFGLTTEKMTVLSKLNVQDAVDQLFEDSKQFSDLSVISDPRPKNGDVKNLKALLMSLKSKKDIENLNLGWLNKMAISKGQLRERMTLFWHDHFATKVKFGILMQEQNNTIRRHAIGSFKELLLAIAKDPAMILFLNNQQNRKKAPNENFARELMELFTFGQGNVYSENDIKEVARAFTGWQVNKRGEYFFNQRQHDFGDKEIFGEKKEFTGEEVIELILSKKECATFICEKVYAYFVNEKLDANRIQELSSLFYESDYNIETLMRSIFTSKWFYSQEHFGMKIKSPTDLLVQFIHLIQMKPDKPRMLVKLQKALGQVLFFPPNVAGWKGGRSWIDSSSLPLRMRLPGAFFGSEVEVNPSEELSLEKSDLTSKKKNKFKASSNWKKMSKVPAYLNSQWKEFADYLLAADLDQAMQKLIEEELNQQTFKTDEDKAQWIMIRIMSLPEFQLS